MITGINRNERIEYIIKKEVNATNPTIFVLKGLTIDEFVEVNYDKISINNKEQSENKTEIDSSKSMLAIVPTVVKGLVEIRNFCTKKGEEPKTITEVTRDIINTLPLEVVSELYAEIMANSKMSGEEIKN